MSDHLPIRIGTRDSKLALWQADTVKQLLELHGHACELVPVKSEGDLDLVTPLYAMGVQGVFTKTLDAYLISNKVDIAVHSMKDVPTQLAQGIVQAAVLKRGNTKDVLVLKDSAEKHDLATTAHIIGTGSVRRKAQWLNRYPHHSTENLRGNVQTRLQKLKDNKWYGAIFAAAGLERMNLLPSEAVSLDWMLPAPAQGAVMVVCREDEDVLKDKCAVMNDGITALCTRIERDFLSRLMGGCSTPIGALAIPENDKIVFKGNILSPDGKNKMETELSAQLAESDKIGSEAAETLLRNGAGTIVAQIRHEER